MIFMCDEELSPKEEARLKKFAKEVGESVVKSYLGELENAVYRIHMKGKFGFVSIDLRTELEVEFGKKSGYKPK